MKLKEIIKASNWEAVRKAFLRIYPSQKKSIIGYEIVHKKLRAKPTTISTSYNEKRVIFPNHFFAVTFLLHRNQNKRRNWTANSARISQ